MFGFAYEIDCMDKISHMGRLGKTCNRELDDRYIE
jgi:hypothetical protein